MRDVPAAAPAAGPLAGLRVLDLTDFCGALAARLLGDLGADVVRVEPPGGVRLRRAGPFLEGRPDPEASCAHWYYDSSKRSVVLDATTPAGVAELHERLAHADVLIEASPQDTLAAAGLSAGELRRRHPHLIHVAVSPLGRSGPRAHWRGSELVCASLGGMVFVNGQADGAPVAPFGLQAYNSAGLFAAIGALCALFARVRSGRGATVDVSVAAAALGAVEHVTGFYRQSGAIETRRGTLHWTRAFRLGSCRDGWVLHSVLGDWTSLSEWVAAEDASAECLRDPRWEDVGRRREECETLLDALDRWAAGRSAAEIAQGAQARRLPLARACPPHELAADPQLVARGFPIALAPQGRRPGSVLPGAPFVLSATPWAMRRRPPRLGEHQAEVRADPGWSGPIGEPEPRAPAGRMALEVQAGGRPDAHPRPGEPSGGSPPERAARPLDGVTVLDFTWVVAGPVATRILADQGARVIKVERAGAPDFGSRRDGLTGNLNRGKQSLVLDLARPRGIEIARRLAARCDIVIDNFSARVMSNLGLDYESLCRLRRDVIAVRMTGFGLDGPCRDHVSYGPTLQAMVGFPFLMRLPGAPPTGWGYSWSDMAAGMMGALATMAALWHRDHTGEGQQVDLSQLESLVALLGPRVLDLLRGLEVEALGNASQEGPAVPHGIYRCAARPTAGGGVDDQRWLAIAVLDDAAWRGLVAVLLADGERWAAEPALARLDERERRREELDRRLGDWARARGAEGLQERLQASGVPAGLVANGEDLCRRDPQLAARGFFAAAACPEGGVATFDGVPFCSSELPGYVAAPGPLLGEHTDPVLSELLGLGASELGALREEGVIG